MSYDDAKVRIAGVCFSVLESVDGIVSGKEYHSILQMEISRCFQGYPHLAEGFEKLCHWLLVPAYLDFEFGLPTEEVERTGSDSRVSRTTDKMTKEKMEKFVDMEIERRGLRDYIESRLNGSP